MNKIFITGAVVAVVVGGGAFYGGMKYAERRSTGTISPQDMQNMSPEQRQQMLQRFRGSGGTGRRSDGEFVNGEILSKDDKSITVKMRDGGSKIIFLSGSTSIGKIAEGTVGDLEAGKQVTVNGTANSDGSVTAQNIQIRPNMPAPGQPTP